METEEAGYEKIQSQSPSPSHSALFQLSIEDAGAEVLPVGIG